MLENRGPNAHTEVTLKTDNFDILLSGFVLWQQGAKICSQPHSYKHHVLLINGDIFSKRDDHSLSDTEWMAQQIDECNDNETELLQLLQTLEGPFSIFYFNKRTRHLYFLRDVFGRQSLLLARSPDDDIILSSVLGASRCHYSKCIELPPLGIFRMDVDKEEISLYPWQSLSDTHLEQLNDLHIFFEGDIKVKSIIASPWLIKEPCTDGLHNFNFESILKDHGKNSSDEIFEHLLDNRNVLSVCNEVIIKLENSLSDRISATPSLCRECVKSNDTSCDHAKIGILFSGGIDCTILAVLTDKLLDSSQSIDLINVSFEKVNRSTSKTPVDYNTPDRITARESLHELKQINPKRYF